MSNLVPVKRMNKNGVLVTKHVRSESNQQRNVTGMPSPRITQVQENPRVVRDHNALTKRLKRMDKARVRTFSRRKMPIYANPMLERWFKTSYKFSVSDNDFYSALEKLTLGDTIVLMSAGMKANEVNELLHGKGNYAPYGQDNSSLVKGLKERGIPVEDYLTVAHNAHIEYQPEDRIVDAAEALVLLKDDEYGFARDSFPMYIGTGAINLSDMKEIGSERCNLAPADFVSIMPYFKDGTSKCTAEELGLMLDRLESEDDKILGIGRKKTLLALRSRMATRYGVDFMESISNPMNLYFAEEHVGSLYDHEAMDFLRYADNVGDGNYLDTFDDKGVEVARYKKQLWEAKVDVETASKGLSDGMSADQIIGVQQHGIEPVVSSGWL